jgi:hypothetical protein
MKYLLDTNICIAIIKHKPPVALNHVLQHAADDLGVSSVTVAELRYGADRSAYPQQNHAALDAFLAPLGGGEFRLLGRRPLRCAAGGAGARGPAARPPRHDHRRPRAEPGNRAGHQQHCRAGARRRPGGRRLAKTLTAGSFGVRRFIAAFPSPKRLRSCPFLRGVMEEAMMRHNQGAIGCRTLKERKRR